MGWGLGSAVQAATYGAFDERYWSSSIGARTASGMRVSADTAMTISTYYDCLNVLCQDIASLPLFVYSYRQAGGRDRATSHPLYQQLHSSPNSYMTSYEFRMMLMNHLVQRGNMYNQLIPGPRGFADQIIPLHPDAVKVELLPNNVLRYSVHKWNVAGLIDDRSAPPLVLIGDQMWHLKGLSNDGYLGVSLINLARENIGVSLALQSFTAANLGNGLRPSMTLELDGTLTDKARKNLRDSLKEQHGGVLKAGSPMILEGGMKAHTISMTAEEAQFIETTKSTQLDITRWFRMQPHKVGIIDGSKSFASVEQSNIEHVTDTLIPWLTLIEQSANKNLILAQQTYYVKFLVAGLLRGDLASRYAAYAIARTWGWLNVNEIREMEEMNPIGSAGNVYLQPLNMGPLGQQPLQAVTAQQLKLFTRDAAARVVRREVAAVTSASRRYDGLRGEWLAWLDEHYTKHAAYVQSTLHLSRDDAERYCRRQRESLAMEGIGVMDTWAFEVVPHLVGLMTGMLDSMIAVDEEELIA